MNLKILGEIHTIMHSKGYRYSNSYADEKQITISFMEKPGGPGNYVQITYDNQDLNVLDTRINNKQTYIVGIEVLKIIEKLKALDIVTSV